MHYKQNTLLDSDIVVGEYREREGGGEREGERYSDREREREREREIEREREREIMHWAAHATTL